MLIEFFGGPVFGDEAHEAGFGDGGVGARGEGEALGDAEVVAVDTKGAAAEGGEVDDGRGDLCADAFEGFEPFADFFRAVFGEEIQGEGAVAGGDAEQRGLEAGGFDLGESDGCEGLLDVGEGCVAERLPTAGGGSGRGFGGRACWRRIQRSWCVKR